LAIFLISFLLFLVILFFLRLPSQKLFRKLESSIGFVGWLFFFASFCKGKRKHTTKAGKRNDFSMAVVTAAQANQVQL